MALKRKSGGGPLIRCASGALATNCCDPGGIDLFSCAEVETYLKTKSTKSVTFAGLTANAPTGTCECLDGCSGITAAPGGSFSQSTSTPGVWWEFLEEDGISTICNCELQSRNQKIQYQCFSTYLRVRANYAINCETSGSPSGPGITTCNQSFFADFRDDFTWPGGGFISASNPVSTTFLDSVFELPIVSGDSPSATQCYLSSGATATVS